MADEYGIKLKVTADTADAQKELDRLLEAKSKRVQEAAAAAAGGGAASSSPSGGSSDAGRKAGVAAAQEFNRAASAGSRKTGRDIAKGFGDEAAGGAAGRAIGKAVAGFAMQQIVGTAFASARTPGGDNTNVDRAQSAVSGALQYGTMGAMLGGPWGAAIGALVGGVSGLAGQLAAERQQRQEVRNGYRMQWNQANESTLAGWGSMAKSRLLDWQGSREGRLEWLAENRMDTARAVNAAQAKMESVAGMDKTSNEFVRAQQDLSRAMAAYQTAVNDEAQERMRPLYDPYSVGDFGDSMGARGLFVGPQVDVAGANDKVIEQQTRMVDLLQKLVDLSNQGNGLDNANYRAAQDVIMSLQ